MSVHRIAIFLVFTLAVAATASADTVRVIVERALVWTQPGGGVSIVMNQLLKGQTAEVVRRVGDWYEIVAPPGSGGGNRRTGFISASQVVLESGTQRGGTATPGRNRTPIAASRSGSRRRSGRILNLDANVGVGGGDVTRSFSAFTDLFAEAGSISTNYGKHSGAGFNALFVQPVAGPIGVGGGVDYFVSSPGATVDARVPHPFFFNQLRDATFGTSGLSAHEAAINFDGVWMPKKPLGSLKIMIFGGPTIFHVSQTVVTDVVLNSQYPFDTVTITGVKTANRTSNLFGFHIGGDVAYFFSPSTGVGGGLRFSHAKLKFDNDSGVTTDGSAGGVSVVAGLRFRF
jgi:hypothetical protein